MRALTLALGLLVATTGFSQTEPGAKPAEKPVDPAAARLAELEKKVELAVLEWRKEQMEASKKAREAAGEGGVIPAMSMMPPFAKFIPDYKAAAEEFKGTEGAVPFLLWITQYGFEKKDEVVSATHVLLGDHMSSPQLAQLARALPNMSRMLGEKTVDGSLDQLIVNSPHAAVKGWAVFGKFGSKLEDPNLAVGSDEYKRYKTMLEKAAEASKDPQLIGEVKGVIAEREMLGNGNVAPDIEGVDLDGVKFKLSDYAGKVVMLDFWGDW